MRRFLPLALSSITALAFVACSPMKQQGIAVGEPNPSAPDAGGIVMEQTNLSWRFEDVGTEDQPMVKILLVISGTDTKEVELGTYAGSATDTTDQQTEALLSASAWWAGGGDDVRVIANGDGTLDLEHRTTDEVSGFGDWTTLQTIDE